MGDMDRIQEGLVELADRRAWREQIMYDRVDDLVRHISSSWNMEASIPDAWVEELLDLLRAAKADGSSV